MRRVVLLLSCILVVVFSTDIMAQSRGSRRRQSPREAPRAVPRQQAPQRAVPRPPQRYERNRRNYPRQYHYGGRWSYRTPRPYRHYYRHDRGWRHYVCQPGSIIFIRYYHP